jgi:hypothetical protein
MRTMMSARAGCAWALLFTTACGDGGSADPGALDAGLDALPWDQGGADTPEYSLGRLLVAPRDPGELVVVDLDEASVVGSIPGSSATQVYAGSNGRYGYAWDASSKQLVVVDPGLWLLSHIDHFHVVRGEAGLRPEALELTGAPRLSVAGGWVTAHDGSVLAAFQERSITAQSFAPRRLPARGGRFGFVLGGTLVAADERGALATLDLLDEAADLMPLAGCANAQAPLVRADDALVFCDQGLVRVDLAEGAVSVEALRLAPPLAVPAGSEPSVLTEREGLALGALGPALLFAADLRGATTRTRALEDPVRAQHVHPRTGRWLTLTEGGVLSELDPETLESLGELSLCAPGDCTQFALSQAYAYVADSKARQIRVVELDTLSEQPPIELDVEPGELVVLGLPPEYFDPRL